MFKKEAHLGIDNYSLSEIQLKFEDERSKTALESKTDLL